MTAQPVTTPPPPRPRRRVGRRLVALVLIVVAAAMVTTLRPGTSMDTGHAQLDGAARGTYRFADGELLTLFGSARVPDYELGGRVTRLLVDDTDVLVSMSGDDTLTLLRDAAGAVTGVTLERPDEPPAFASVASVHTEQEVRFDSDGAALAATLLLPAGPGPHPAVVFAHGAGAHDRHGTFWLIGSHMARRGVAALVHDKRGVGESTGSHTTATFDDLTADLLAGVDLLTAHPAVDPARIGVAGFSQGGWTAADAARRSDDVAFVIAMSPSGFVPADQQAWLHGSMLAARGFDRSAMAIADRVSRMQYSSLELVDAGLLPPMSHVPGFWFHALDPYRDTAALWQGVGQPALLLWGANDCQVPAHDSMDVLGEALRRGGNTHVTLAVLAGADHGLTVQGPCAMEATGHHDASVYAEEALTLGPDWVNALPDRPAAVPVAARPETDVLAWHLEPPEPAPWYGTLAVQSAAVVLLLGLFGSVAGRWVVAAGRSRAGRRGPAAWHNHLAGAAALVGVAATVAGVAAFTEIAVLGAVHAEPLVGPPLVDGAAPLMVAARTLITLSAALSAASVVTTLRRLRAGADPAVWAVLAASVLLVLWAGYWKLLPLM